VEVLCWIITIPYFGLWAIVAAPLLWLADNGVRTLILPYNKILKRHEPKIVFPKAYGNGAPLYQERGVPIVQAIS
jgi:hypothetical protein